MTRDEHAQAILDAIDAAARDGYCLDLDVERGLPVATFGNNEVGWDEIEL